MINENGDNMVEHHTKYKEIHGYDETVWMTFGEHKKLHNRLRRENRCNIPVNKLSKISKTAHSRTKKSKENQRNYRVSENGKRVREIYNKSNHGIKVKHEYIRSEQRKEVRKKYQRNIKTIYFTMSPGTNTSFREKIDYNHKTGTINYYSVFCGRGGFTLPVINI